MTPQPSRVDSSQLKSIVVLHEDESIIVVAKPAGMSVHGGAGEKRATVIDLVRSASRPQADIHLVHRLDRGTSGVLVLAKNKDVARTLGARWDRAEKRYVAIVFGAVTRAATIAIPLEAPDGRARDARTHVEPDTILDAFEPGTSLVRIRIEEGRMHQIRRHLEMHGHPVVMDRQHGDFSRNRAWSAALRGRGGPRIDDVLLHCRSIVLPHPARPSSTMEFSAELPALWVRVLEICGVSKGAVPTT